MSKFLVTGGCGFIGSHLCRYLIAEGHEVVVLDNLDTGKKENLAEGASFIEDSVTNQACVETLFQDIDGCFHLAAIASVVRCQEECVMAHEVNSKGFMHILNAAKKNQTPIVYASSAAVYGNLETQPLDETMSVEQISFYGADKFHCERMAKIAFDEFRIPSIGLRFFNVYGPGQDPKSPYSGVISIFMDKVIKAEPIIIFGDGEQTRDFIYIADVIQYLYLSMNQVKKLGTDVFNVCSGQSNSLNELIDILSKIESKQPEVIHENAREGDIRFSCGKASKIIDSLKYQPQFSLNEGLKLLLQSQKKGK